MTDPLVGLENAIAELRAAWTTGLTGDLVAAEDLGRAQLMAVTVRVGAVNRQLDAIRTAVAAEVSRQSRPELGADSLAKEQGFRTPAILIATTTGATTGEAARLIKVGEATAPRRTLTGQSAPPKNPHVAAALQAGRISAAAADAIVRMLDRVGARAALMRKDDAERILAAQAEGLALDQLAKVIARAEAHLDPDGLEPKEQELRGQRSLVMFERDGLLHLNAKLDPASAAPVKTAIEHLVTASFRSEAAIAPVATAGQGDAPISPGDADAPRRTVAQRQADALVMIAEHVTGCESSLPLDGPTVIVRMTLDQLRSGTGVAEIDGLTQPVSATTARRLAAAGGVIPLVLGGDSEILDFGRVQRLFSKAQKLAMVERDGGCAMCALPPGMTKAHHLEWWSRDTGPTDLDNGCLLCETCHHRIHDNGWTIRITGTGTTARVWFIPPPHVDPAQTPRLGGRARYDYAA